MTSVEVWKPVAGYEGIYDVSSLGRVRSLSRPRRRETRILKGSPVTKGYLQVHLHDGPTHAGGRLVSNLVCEAFKGPRPKNYECAHINGDKLDNRAENLEWVSTRENNWHKREHGTMLRGEQCHMAKLTAAQVLEIMELSKAGDTDRQIAKRYSVDPATVNSIMKGRTWSVVTGIKADRIRVAELMSEVRVLTRRAEAAEQALRTAREALGRYRQAQRWATGTESHRIALAAADQGNPVPHLAALTGAGEEGE